MLTAFRILGLLEGFSFVVLLLIAMPLKYVWGIPEVTKVVGMAHGLLFVAYVLYSIQIMMELELRKRFVLQTFLAASLPFGPFLFEKRILRGLVTAEA